VEEIRVLARLAAETMTRDVREYFEGRGLTQATTDRYWLGRYGYGFTIPVFDSEDGQVVTLKFRRDDLIADENTPKYWGLRGHNEPRVYPWPVTPDDATIVLVEGEFDCLILRQAGVNAFSLTSGAASWNKITQATFPAGTRVVVLYDCDPAGIEAVSHLVNHLPKMGYLTELMTLPPGIKDISEMAVKEPKHFTAYVKTIRNTLWTPQNQPMTTPTTPPLVVSPS
jgi:DNA primase